MACFTGLVTILWRHQIAAVYNNDPVVLGLASHLLLFAATYQITDAVQVVSVGILRGYNDTRAILCVTLISYWVFALPVGYTLGRTHLWGDPLGPQGFWRSLSAYPLQPSFWSSGFACWNAGCSPDLIGSGSWKGKRDWGGRAAGVRSCGGFG